uniref:Uncharacterized protein n=1 Tax=Rhizophora mucronata TaxID=61149 RepID=A0A2P2PWD6_RHIMU
MKKLEWNFLVEMMTEWKPSS